MESYRSKKVEKEGWILKIVRIYLWHLSQTVRVVAKKNSLQPEKEEFGA